MFKQVSKRIHWITPVIALLVVLALAVPVHAQDGAGLSSEQQALLDRAQAAVDALKTYDNFAVSFAARERFEVEVLKSYADRSVSATVMPGDSLALRADFVAHDDITFELMETSRDVYTLEGALRLVDGTLYVDTVRTVSEGDEAAMEPVPSGWAVIDSADDFPALGVLGLVSLLEGDPYRWLLPLPPGTERVWNTPTEVTLESTTLDDGTPADQIALRLERGGVSDEGEAIAALTVVTLTLGADDTLLAYDLLDRLIMAPEATPEDISAIFETSVRATFSDFNAEVEPVTAPEL